MKPTQEILERIRDLAGLKKLEEGCQINKGGEVWTIWQKRTDGQGTTIVNREFVSSLQDGDKFEIIGLPVQLNDLLRVCRIKLDEDPIFIEVMYPSIISKYDLDLTVEQNLETNPDFRSLISNLIF